jgi:hypothetical protein
VSEIVLLNAMPHKNSSNKRKMQQRVDCCKPGLPDFSWLKKTKMEKVYQLGQKIPNVH